MAGKEQANPGGIVPGDGSLPKGGDFSPFTTEELAKLNEIGSKDTVINEMMLDPRLLEFARWLYGHGIITEFPDTTKTIGRNDRSRSKY